MSPHDGVITMQEKLSLSNLVDLAIGTPEGGYVNFNALHAALRNIVNYLGIAHAPSDVISPYHAPPSGAVQSTPSLPPQAHPMMAPLTEKQPPSYFQQSQNAQPYQRGIEGTGQPNVSHNNFQSPTPTPGVVHGQQSQHAAPPGGEQSYQPSPHPAAQQPSPQSVQQPMQHPQQPMQHPQQPMQHSQQPMQHPQQPMQHPSQQPTQQLSQQPSQQVGQMSQPALQRPSQQMGQGQPGSQQVAIQPASVKPAISQQSSPSAVAKKVASPQQQQPTSDGIDQRTGLPILPSMPMFDSRPSDAQFVPSGQITAQQLSLYPMQHEQRLTRIEQQFEELNQLPSNKKILGEEKEKRYSVKDLWKLVKIEEKTESHAIMLDKLSSLVDDLNNELQLMKEKLAQSEGTNSRLEDRIARLESEKKGKDEKQIKKQLADLDNKMKKLKAAQSLMEDKLAVTPGLEDLVQFVTWDTLEDALKGDKDKAKAKVEQSMQSLAQLMQSQVDMKRASSAPKDSEDRKTAKAKDSSDESSSSQLQQKKKDSKSKSAESKRKGSLEDSGLRLARRPSIEKSHAHPSGIMRSETPSGDDQEGVDSDTREPTPITDVKEFERPPSEAAPSGGEQEQRPGTPPDTGKKSSDDGSVEPPPLKPKWSLRSVGSTNVSFMSGKSGPSEELFDMLEDVGKSVSTHKSLEKRVSVLEEKMLDKADKSEVMKIVARLKASPVDGSAAPPSSIEDLRQQLQELKENQLKLSKRSQEWKAAIKDLEKVFFKDLRDMEAKARQNLKEVQDQLEALNSAASTAQPVCPVKSSQSTKSTKLPSAAKEVSESKDRLVELEQQVHNLQEHLEDVLLHRRGSSSHLGGVVDAETMAKVHHTLRGLRTELDSVTLLAQQLVDENINKEKNLVSLSDLVQALESKKADREFVISEVEVKADKKSLDSKVNRTLFDKTMEELNKMVEDLLKKLTTNDEEWRNMLKELGEEMEAKLDREQFGRLKENLEKQLRSLSKKINNMGTTMRDMDDEAAGLRRKLAVRFNCISCDKPVDVIPHPPIPSIPNHQGLPGSRTTRPYTTYELDQIRQHARSACAGKNSLIAYEQSYLEKHGMNQPGIRLPKNLQQPQMEVVDLYATQRACGGSHTMTYPQRRLTRVVNPSYFEQLSPIPTGTNQSNNRPETSPIGLDRVLGANGQVYRGRPGSTRSLRVAPMSGGGEGSRPSTAFDVLPSPRRSTMPEGQSHQVPITDRDISYAAEVPAQNTDDEEGPPGPRSTSPPPPAEIAPEQVVGTTEQ